MKSTTFKTKILLLAMLPLVTISIVLTVLAIYQTNKLGQYAIEQTQQLGNDSVSNFKDKIYDLRRKELKNYTELAMSSIRDIYSPEYASSDEELDAQARAKDIINALEFGEDGYFFVYDYDAVNLVHPKKPQLIGRNLWKTEDKNGVLLLQELIANAKAGGGFTNYVWDKPSLGRAVDKIGYSLGVDKWQWMVGTGLYVDDLEDSVKNVSDQVETSIQQVSEQVDENLSNTLKLIGLLAIGGTLLVGLIGARFTMSQGQLADNKLQQLSRKNVEVQEAERSRVSRQLQSGINQALVASRAKLQKVAKAKSLTEPAARKEFIAAVSILNKTIKEVYRISGELRPGVLDQMGLYSAVESLTQDMTTSTGININFKSVDMEERLRPEMETAIYRIIQEALKNIQLHSQATNATVRIRQTHKLLTVNIQDNGQGFNAKEIMGGGSKAGIGLIDMRVRAESLGGVFTVFASKGSGTMVKVEVPLG